MKLLAAVRTPVTAMDVAEALGLAWLTLTGEPAPHVAILLVLAQSAYETGRWKSCVQWNLGGAKWTSDSGCDFAIYGTSEGYGAASTHSEQRFLAFPSLTAGAASHLTMLRHTYPKAWAALPSGEVGVFVEALRSERYFTGDPQKYSAGVASLAHEYRDLPFSIITPDDARRTRNLVAATMAAEPLDSPDEEPTS